MAGLSDDDSDTEDSNHDIWDIMTPSDEEDDDDDPINSMLTSALASNNPALMMSAFMFMATAADLI